MTPAKVRVRRRVWVEGVLRLNELGYHSLTAHDADDDALAFAERVWKLAGGRPHMIELEFLDEPDPHARFYRWGTDAAMMAFPLRVM